MALTNKQKLSIRKDGRSSREIALAHGISQTMVLKVQNEDEPLSKALAAMQSIIDRFRDIQGG